MCRTRKKRAKPLDLVRRARLLGVTHGHLSRVLRGERESQPLLARLQRLMERESARLANKSKTPN